MIKKMYRCNNNFFLRNSKKVSLFVTKRMLNASAIKQPNHGSMDLLNHEMTASLTKQEQKITLRHSAYMPFEIHVKFFTWPTSGAKSKMLRSHKYL